MILHFKLINRFEVERQLGSTAAELPVTFQSDMMILNQAILLFLDFIISYDKTSYQILT